MFYHKLVQPLTFLNRQVLLFSVIENNNFQLNEVIIKLKKNLKFDIPLQKTCIFSANLKVSSLALKEENTN